MTTIAYLGPPGTFSEEAAVRYNGAGASYLPFASIPAVVTAVETADACLGVIVEATHGAGGVCLVTADHGNAEKLLEDDGVSPHTAHTTNPVPLVLTRVVAGLKDGGELSDIAPTVLDLLGLAQPDVMTGTTLAAPGNR